jgi:hypothetical protein
MMYFKGDVLKREDGSPPVKKLKQLDLKQMKQGQGTVMSGFIEN